MLKPQDVFVAVYLAGRRPAERSYARVAAATGMSGSETHAAVKRAAACGLVDAATREVRKAALREFLVHGLRYVFPAERLGVTRGVPTSYAAPPLSAEMSVGDLPPVWPHAHGTVRGEGVVPLYRSVADAATRDPRLYEWLALLDALRGGRARERQLAIREVEKRLS